MHDVDLHILQAAEEKLERLTSEVFKLREEIDRYSKSLSRSDTERQRYRDALIKITATGENEPAKMARDALEA